MRRSAILAGVIAVLALLGGCSSVIAGQAVPAGVSSSPDDDRQLVVDYYEQLNAAAEEGSNAQRQFLQHTQHPDFTDRFCDLGDLTLHVQPAMSTFRPDPAWVPPEEQQKPRGSVYVIGVSISVREAGTLLGEQIGSQRVVVLEGQAYGFSPCPTSG